MFRVSEEKLAKGQWMVGGSEIMRIRVVCDVVVDGVLALIDESCGEEFVQRVRSLVESLCSFALIMYNYKLEQSTE